MLRPPPSRDRRIFAFVTTYNYSKTTIAEVEQESTVSCSE